MARSRETVLRPEAPSGDDVRDIFISYNQADRTWAEWIAWTLEEAGFTILIQAWDFRPGQNFVLAMHEASTQTRYTVIVLSPSYLAAEYTQPEWAAAFARDPLGRERTLIPVRVRECQPEGLLGQVIYVDLVGLSEGDAVGPLTTAFAERARPVERPSFPGRMARPGRRRAPYPGTLAPSYASETIQTLSEALADAYRRQEELLVAESDTSTVTAEILELRRRLREGGQLKAGDFLADGRFRLLDLLGKGGFANVWKAFDRQERGFVAVKVLHSQYAEDRTRRERFFRGARRMAELRHEGVVRVIERQLEDGGYHFFVMEHIGGGDLRRAVLEGRIRGEEGLTVIRQVGQALHFAHESGLIHRDVKPANVLLDEDGRPKLTDFDLVSAFDTTGGTRTGTVLGTFFYMAPEAMTSAKNVGPEADVYSLAMTTIFVLNGKELPPSVLRHTESFVDGLSCSPTVKDALHQAAIWEVGSRFRSVVEFLDALEKETGPSHEPEEPRPRPEGDRWTDPKTGMTFLRIRPGTFMMGSAEGDPLAYKNERPPHEVTLTDEFWIGECLISNKEYRLFEPFHRGEENMPATGVTWHQAKAFCERFGYRLPTEAEWEYAARAGTTTPWPFRKDEINHHAWHKGNSEERLHPVGQKKQNPWGLYDMHGNAWEWTSDLFRRYPKKPRIDQSEDTSKDQKRGQRVLRGGSFADIPQTLRSAVRGKDEPEFSGRDISFRCVIDLRLAKLSVTA